MTPAPAARRLAQVVSLVLHPFVLTPLTVFALAARRGPLAQAGRLGGSVAALLVLPLLALIALRVRSGAWSDYDVSVHQERHGFYRQAVVLLLAGSLAAVVLFPELRRGVLAAWILVLSSMLANRFLKSSLHVGFGAFCAVLLAHGPLGGALAASGLLLLAWSRVALSRHTVPEVISGALLGAAAAAALRLFG